MRVVDNSLITRANPQCFRGLLISGLIIQQTRPSIFPNGGLINAVPPSNPTTSLEQNSRDTDQKALLSGITSSFEVLLQSV